MDILSKETLALLADDALRNKIQELLDTLGSDAKVTVGGEAPDASVGNRREERQVVVRRLVA